MLSASPPPALAPLPCSWMAPAARKGRCRTPLRTRCTPTSCFGRQSSATIGGSGARGFSRPFCLCTRALLREQVFPHRGEALGGNSLLRNEDTQTSAAKGEMTSRGNLRTEKKEASVGPRERRRFTLEPSGSRMVCRPKTYGTRAQEAHFPSHAPPTRAFIVSTRNSCIPHVTSLADPASIAPLALYGSVLASAALAVLRRDAAVMWGLALVVVPFVPASNVFFPVGAVVAERVGSTNLEGRPVRALGCARLRSVALGCARLRPVALGCARVRSPTLILPESSRASWPLRTRQVDRLKHTPCTSSSRPFASGPVQ